MNDRKRILPLRLAILSVVLAWSSGVAPESRAQQQDEDGQPVLPDLAPREVEIRGQLQISFPSLRRQPLVGFNPPPRVPEIPLDRRPFLESYTQAGAPIAHTPMRKPDPPGVAALSDAPPFQAEAEIATGRYFTRLVRGLAVKRMGPHRQLGIKLEYHGTDGQALEISDSEVKNASDDFAGSLRYLMETGQLAVSAEITGFLSAYSLFGISDSVGGNVVPNPDRDGQGAALRVSVGSAPTSRTGYSLSASLENTKYSSDLFPSASIVDPSTERTERRVTLAGELAFPVRSSSAYTGGKASWAGLDAGGIAGSDLMHAEIGAGALLRSERLALKAGPRILTIRFDADVGGVAGEDGQATYLSADVDLNYRSGGVLTLIGTNRPYVRANTLSELFAENPYLIGEPAMQPSVLPVNAEAGLLFAYGAVQFKASIQLRQSPNWAYFTTSLGTGTATVAEGFFESHYAEARVTSAGGEMAISLPAGLQLSSSVYVHDTELTKLNVRIPFLPRLTGELGLSVPFASRRGLLQATGRFIGERYTNLSVSETVDPYLDVDLYARYDFGRTVGLIARVQNLGINDHEIWSGYPQSPGIFMLGVRMLW